MKQPAQIIVFTDLDGTLLDSGTYSFAAARQSLELLSGQRIPLIPCTSKTRCETEHYRKRLGNHHPFVCENGGGIFIPEGYFNDRNITERHGAVCEGSYRVIRLGAPYRRLRMELARLRAQGFAVTGFGDLTADEIAARTGLPLIEAVLCKEREFDEPFFFREYEERRRELCLEIQDRGLQLTEGKMLHLTGGSDKGRAIDILIECYREHYGDVTTIALGDAPNDLPMLERVDYPAVVLRSDGTVHPELSRPGFHKADGIGPEGWNRMIPELLQLAGRQW